MRGINIRHLLIFVLLISWLGVLPGLLSSYEIGIPRNAGALQILMTLGPILGAVIFIIRSSGWKGIKAFFSRLLLFRTSALVLVLAILIPIIIPLLSSYVGLQYSDAPWPDRFTTQYFFTTGISTFLIYLLVNTEELVWRGIVFDNFLNKFGFVKACLMLIPIWWLFHIPLFLFAEGHQAGYGIAPFTLLVIGETFILGWIYVKSKRSLLYVHLHHQLLNGFGQAAPLFPIFIGGNQIPIWVFSGMILIIGLFLAYGQNVKSKM